MLQELTAEKQKIQRGKVPEMWLKKLIKYAKNQI